MWMAKAKAKKNIKLENTTVKENSDITITKGIKYKYAIWHHDGIYDLPERYVKNIETLVEE